MGGTIRQLAPHTDTTDGGLNTDTDSSKCWRLRVLDPGAGGSGWGEPALGLKTSPSCACMAFPPCVERGRERQREGLWGPLLLEGLQSCWIRATRMTSFNRNDLRTWAPWGLDLQHGNFGKNTVQSIAGENQVYF